MLRKRRVTATTQSEEWIHQQIVNYLRWALPPDAVLHHSANESRGSIGWHAKRVRLGMRAGWPDLEIIYRGKFIGLEVKTRLGRVSTKQKRCHKDIMLAGGAVCVVRSLDQTIDFLTQLIPDLRGPRRDKENSE